MEPGWLWMETEDEGQAGSHCGGLRERMGVTAGTQAMTDREVSDPW